MKKALFPINSSKLLALLSPRDNVQCIIGKRVAGVLQPSFSPATKLKIAFAILKNVKMKSVFI